MKRLLAVICFLIMLFLFVLSAFSAHIDGFDTGAEWDGATTYKLVNGESNCGVNFGAVKVEFDFENSAVFLCFMFIDPVLEQDNSLAGISLEIENSSPFEITLNNSPSSYDIQKYSFDGALSVDENNGVTCEIRIGIKSGLPKTLDGRVRFIDAKGEPSNYYNFSLINEKYVETTALEIAPTHDNSDPAYNPDLLTSKTANAKRTTQKRSTTQKFVIKTSPPYSYTGKTKETSKKSTEPAKSETLAAATIVYYEKEVIISHIPVTEAAVNVIKNELTATGTTHSVETEMHYSTEVSETSKTMPLSKGQKYKTIATFFGGLLFLIIAVFGAFSAKKNRDSSNNTEEE